MARYFAYGYIEYNGKIIERLGSDGCINLDGRLSLYNMRLAAWEWAKKKGYIGFHIERCADGRLSNGIIISDLNHSLQSQYKKGSL